MISAEKGYVAVFGRMGDDGRMLLENAETVIAWDDDGMPLVLGERRLERADTWGNFRCVRWEDSEIVAVIPAGPFQVEHRPDDGPPWRDPLVGWALTSSGSVVPLDTDPGGLVEVLTETAGKFRITHPHDEAF